MENINIDVIANDIKIEMDKVILACPPMTIEKTNCYVRLRNFKYDMVSTCFIRFLDRFCSERDLDWIISFETKSVLIG